MTQPNSNSEIAKISALITVAIIGAAVLLLLPIVIGAVADGKSFTAVQIGIIGSSDMFGAAIVALFIGPAIQRYDWRVLVALASVILVALNLISTLSLSFGLFAGVRLMAGFCEGVLLSVGNTGLATSGRPDRNVALYLVVALLAGAVGIQIFAGVANDAGTSGVFLALAMVSTMAVFATRWLPRSVGSSKREVNVAANLAGADRSGPGSRFVWLALIGVLGVLLYFVALGLIWGNMKLIGADARVDADLVDRALAVSLVAGMLGGICAMTIETRFGRAWPVFISIVASILAVMMSFQMTPTTFFVVTGVLIFGWNFTYPYQVAAVAAVDSTGRYVSKCVSMQLLGFSMGPLIAGALSGSSDKFVVMKWMAIVGFGFAAAMFIPVMGKRQKRQKIATN